MLSRTLTLVAICGFAGAAASSGALANPAMPVVKSQSRVQLVADYDYDGPRQERDYRRGWDGDGPRWGWRGRGWGGRCRFVRHECADRFGWRSWRFDRCLDYRGC